MADEEALPFKMAYVLSHKIGLRLHIQPESTHSMWNDVRNSVRRSGLQHTLLLCATFCNTAHGPFAGGRNKFTLDEAALNLSSSMSQTAFDDLCDQMCADQHLEPGDCDADMLPQDPSDIPKLAALRNLPPYVWALAY